MSVNTVSAVHSDALVSSYDFHKPSVSNKLFRKFGDQGQSFFNIINTWGYVTPVDQTTYSHYEEEFIHENVHVRANVASPGAGNTITFTLGTQDLDAQNRFFIQIGDDVMFANGVTGNVTAINTATPSAPTVTVAPHEVADNIGALTAGDAVIIYSNNYAESTGQPNGHVSKKTKHNFSAKIIKYSVETTGTELTNGNWVDVMSDGKPIKGWFAKGQLDADYEMLLRMDGASLFDKPTTNTALSNVGKRTMTGLVPWIRSGGNIDTYSPGFYELEDFDQINKTLDGQFGASENTIMSGIDLHTDFENLFVNQFTAGAIVYGKEKANPLELNLEVQSLKKGGRGYHFKKMGIFSHPRLYGASGYKTPGMGILMPMDLKKDAKTGNDLPSVGIRYKEMNGYSRKMETWTTGGGKNKVTQVDKDELNMRTERGTQFIANNRFYLIEQ
jgi:hypothetical protein